MNEVKEESTSTISKLLNAAIAIVRRHEKRTDRVQTLIWNLRRAAALLEDNTLKALQQAEMCVVRAYLDLLVGCPSAVEQARVPLKKARQRLWTLQQKWTLRQTRAPRRKG